MKEKQKKDEDGFFKSIISELQNSAIAEVTWSIITFFPKMVFRTWKNFDL